MKLVHDTHTLEILDHDRTEEIVIWTVKGPSHPHDFEFDVHVAYWDPTCIVDIVIGSGEDSDGTHLGKFLPFREFSALCKSVDRRFRIADATHHYLSENGYVRPPAFRPDPDAEAKQRRMDDDERGAP
jgi:hypothetical protein